MKKTIGWSENLGSKLKALRLANKVKQVDLARSLGLSPAYLNLIENDKRPMHVDVLEKLLDFFQIDMDAFMSSQEGRKLQNRIDTILNDPYLQGHSLEEEEVEALRRSSSLSNLLLALYDGFTNAQQELQRLQQRLFTEEQDREGEDENRRAGAPPDALAILDRTALDEVTDFLERHGNYFPALEKAAETMLRAESADDGRSVRTLASMLKRRFDIEVEPTDFAPASQLIRLYREKARRLYVSNAFGAHRLHFQIASFLGLKIFEEEGLVEDLIANYPFRRRESSMLARVNLANYFAGALLLPYDQFFDKVKETGYDIRAMEGRFGMPFEPIAHRLCNLSRPGRSGIPLHFIRADMAGNISKKYVATGLKINDRRRTCPKWAVHTAFLTPSILRRQYSTMPDGETFFCVALATVDQDRESIFARNAHSVGIGCRAEDAHHMVYSRGLRFESPERDGVKIGINCRLCDRPDCAQRALPSFKMEYEINTINRKANVLLPISSDDLLMSADGRKKKSKTPRNGKQKD